MELQDVTSWRIGFSGSSYFGQAARGMSRAPMIPKTNRVQGGTMYELTRVGSLAPCPGWEDV